MKIKVNLAACTLVLKFIYHRFAVCLFVLICSMGKQDVPTYLPLVCLMIHVPMWRNRKVDLIVSLSLSRPTRVDVVGGRCLTLAHIGTTSVTRCWNKRSPNFTISSLKSNHSLYWKGMFFKVPQKVNKYLCNFSEKLCQQNLSKIAQSGHTGTFISKLFI